LAALPLGGGAAGRRRKIGSPVAAASDTGGSAATAFVPYAEFFVGAKTTSPSTTTTGQTPAEMQQQRRPPPPSAAAAAAVAARDAHAAVVAAVAATATAVPGPAASALPEWASHPGAEQLRVRTRAGAVVYAAVLQEGAAGAATGAAAAATGAASSSPSPSPSSPAAAGDWRVAVCVSAVDAVKGGGAPGRAPHLHWGLYRASAGGGPSSWRLPPAGSLPEGTARDAATGAARTPMRPDPRRPGVWTAEVRVPRRYAPVQFGFALWHPGGGGAAETLPPLQTAAAAAAVAATAGGAAGGAAAASSPAAARQQQQGAKRKKSGLKYYPLSSPLRAAVDQAASGLTGGTPGPRSAASLLAAAPHYDPSPAGGHFLLPVGVGRGTPRPLGPSVVGRAAASDGAADVNFAVHSRHAGAMSLCILRRAAAEGASSPRGGDGGGPRAAGQAPAATVTAAAAAAPLSAATALSSAADRSSARGGYLEISLDPSVNRTGDVWHVAVRGLRAPRDLLYGWRADGAPGTSWMAGGCFHPGFLLLDPYAPSAALAALPPDAALLAAGAPALPPAGADGARHALLGSLAPLLSGDMTGGDPGGWAAAARLAESVAPLGAPTGAAAAARAPSAAAAAAAAVTAASLAARRPRRPLASTVLVEVDLRELSSRSPSVPERRRGTYLGALQRLGDLAAAGATAVLLRGAMLSDRAVAAAAGELVPAAAAEAAEAGEGPPPHLAPPSRRPLSYFAPEVTLCCADEGGGEAEEPSSPSPPSPPPPPLSSSSSAPPPAPPSLLRQDVAAPRQLKALVAAAHARGLEVLLEADFCLTADAAGGGSPGAGARLQSLAGLDGALYLRGGGGYRGGGVLNAGQPAVRALALAALRRWASEYRVDGFVLANAENLAQDALGAVQDSPPFAEELAADGALGAFSGAVGGGAYGAYGGGAFGGGGAFNGGGGTDATGGVKIIASVSDRALLPRGGGRGFPHYGALAEWNARFGGDALLALRDNAPGSLSALATRLAGSPDLFAPADAGAGWPGGLAAGRAPAWGVNALQPPGARRAPLDVFDDGGAIGAGDARVVARSFLLAQAVSPGVPALDWRALDGDGGLARFASVVLALRARYAALVAPAAFDPPEGQRDLRWHAADAPSGGEPDWSGGLATRGGVAGANFIAFSVFGGAAARGAAAGEQAGGPWRPPPAAAAAAAPVDGAGAGAGSPAAAASAPAAPAARPWEVAHTHHLPHGAPAPFPSAAAAVYVAFNPDPLAAVALRPPPPPGGMRWRRLVDTSRAAPDDAVLGGDELLAPGGGDYVLGRRAALMLDAVPDAPTWWPAAATATGAAATGAAAAPQPRPAPPTPADPAVQRAARYLS